LAIYDYHIRKALIANFANIPCFQTGDTVVIHELDVCGGTSRIDIAVVNGQLHGYEIKSQQDNLMRLETQIEDYSQIFDTMTIVITENHIGKVVELVPDWWGIQYVTGDPENLDIYTKREARKNESINSYQLAQLLWRDELFMLLKEKVKQTNGFASKTRRQLAQLVTDYISFDEIEKYIKSILKSRIEWKAVLVEQPCDGLRNM
jgi:hypothetical protein